MPEFNNNATFPNGDPLDPVVTGLPVKLLQRYVGDLHQIYDVIAWRFTNGIRLETKYETTLLGNPFTRWKVNTNFLVYQRYTLGIDNETWFASNYIDRIYDIFNTIKDWKNRGQQDAIVLEPPFLQETYFTNISSNEYTKILITYYQQDNDGSKALLYSSFEGFNFTVSFNIRDVLPYSVVVTSNNSNVISQVESALPNLLLWKNFDIPVIKQRKPKNVYSNDTALRREENTFTTTIKKFLQQIQTQRKSCRCFTQTPIIAQQVLPLNNLPSGTILTASDYNPQLLPPIPDGQCIYFEVLYDQDDPDVINEGLNIGYITIPSNFTFINDDYATTNNIPYGFSLAVLPVDSLRITIRPEYISPVDSFNIAVTQPDEVNFFSNTRRLFHNIDPDLPYFLHLSYANNNYWGMNTSIKTDKGNPFLFFIESGETTISYSKLIPYRADRNFFYRDFPFIFSQCETISDNTTTDSNTNTFQVGGGLQEKGGGVCTTLPVNNVEEDVFIIQTRVEIRECPLIFDDKEKIELFPLNFEQTINAIDIFYYGG